MTDLFGNKDLFNIRCDGACAKAFVLNCRISVGDNKQAIALMEQRFDDEKRIGHQDVLVRKSSLIAFVDGIGIGVDPIFFSKIPKAFCQDGFFIDLTPLKLFPECKIDGGIVVVISRLGLHAAYLHCLVKGLAGALIEIKEGIIGIEQ